jgi:hypothetical protein
MQAKILPLPETIQNPQRKGIADQSEFAKATVAVPTEAGKPLELCSAGTLSLSQSSATSKNGASASQLAAH